MSILLAFVFSALTAQAMPTIGDTANYNFTFNGEVGQLTQTITAYNATNGVYTVTAITTMNGQTRTEQREETDLLTDDQVATVLTNCTQYGGTLMDVMVPAGTFSTCKVTQTEGANTQDIYFAKDVAFGFVQVNSVQDGQKVDVQLASYTRGQ